MFHDMKTLTFSWSAEGEKRDVSVRFCDRQGAPFVLLSDLWRLSRMEGDTASVMEVYIRSCGKAAAQHFVFKASPPEDALVSQTIAERMVGDWATNIEPAIFTQYSITAMFEEARRVMHGLETIRRLFSLSADDRRLPAFDPVACRLEVDRIATAMLAHSGRPGSGLPALGRREAQFLSRLTMAASDASRARKQREYAVRFFSLHREDVEQRIRPRCTDLQLYGDHPCP